LVLGQQNLLNLGNLHLGNGVYILDVNNSQAVAQKKFLIQQQE